MPDLPIFDWLFFGLKTKYSQIISPNIPVSPYSRNLLREEIFVNQAIVLSESRNICNF